MRSASGPITPPKWRHDPTVANASQSATNNLAIPIVDIFSRKIVGWEVHDREASDLAATLIRQAVLAEDCITRPLVLHAREGNE